MLELNVSPETKQFIDQFYEFTSLVVFWLVVIFAIKLAIMFVQDRFQSTHAIRRNYPIIGRFRYTFEHMGEFFRQYFFAPDRSELPFNRAQRSWVYRASKNISDTIAFGSTLETTKDGNVIFSNHPYPVLEEDGKPPAEIVVGEYSRTPWQTNAIFGISGMSFGAISKPAVRALSRGAKAAGTWYNTGEGGLSKYHLEGQCDLIFQIGTAKYGVCDEDGNLCDDSLRKIAAYETVRCFEVKLSQGAKPGKGGILPGDKVTKEIAEARSIPVGKASISPNRHKDIACDEDLLDMVARIRRVTGKPCGFKMVLGEPSSLNSLFKLIKKRGVEESPDFITLDSSDGGTGAAPMTLMDDVGLTIKESLPMLIATLNRYKLKDRIKVFVSGKMINPKDVAWALCTGADFVCTARGYMLSLGCIQSLQCHKNTCPTGVATHDEKLQRGLVVKDKAKRVANYTKNMVSAVEVLAHSCGVQEPRQLNESHARVCENGHSVPLKTYNENVVEQQKGLMSLFNLSD